MHPTTRLPGLLLFITWLSYFSWNCHAVLNYVYATSNCETYTAIGEAQYCCNGDCADGTTVDSSTGLCSDWMDVCYDPINVPVCNGNQLWSFANRTTVTTGGTCATGCQWKSEQYTYKCCDCPLGYVAEITNCLQSRQQQPVLYDSCVGCTGGAGESLTYDRTTSTYSC
jgi:hypothetical protein